MSCSVTPAGIASLVTPAATVWSAAATVWPRTSRIASRGTARLSSVAANADAPDCKLFEGPLRRVLVVLGELPPRGQGLAPRIDGIDHGPLERYLRRPAGSSR